MSSDVLRGLQQLKQQRGSEAQEKKGKLAPSMPVVEVEVAPETPARGEEKTLAGRVPLAVHRRFSRLLLDTADNLGVNRVYTDEALEAALLALLDDDFARRAWMEKLGEVRQSRRGR